MARAKKPTAQDKPRPSDGKAVFQVRLDSDIHEKLKTAAATAGISMNQLIQGILRWGAEHVRQGRPTLNGEVVGETSCPECVWFGRVTRPMKMGDYGHKGQFVFTLDYSDRKALCTQLADYEVVEGHEIVHNVVDDGDTSDHAEARRRALDAELEARDANRNS